MDLRIKRDDYRADGIFSTVYDADGEFFMKTLEHAYSDSNGGWVPKLQPGIYTCVRGPHRLHGMANSFDTFEVTGVKGHSGILFHWGNYNKDSEGCLLTGSEIAQTPLKQQMVTNSRLTFAKFMALQNGLNNFQLTVEA